MHQPVKVGIVGDRIPELRYHIATEKSLEHAAAALSVSLDFTWITTQSLAEASAGLELQQYHAIWCAPGDYRSMDGAHQAIRFAREQGRPFIGT